MKKRLILIPFLLFTVNMIFAQNLFVGVELDRANSASVLNNDRLTDFSSNNSFGINFELLWERKNIKLSQHGMMLDMKTSTHQTSVQKSVNYKLGLFYTTNFGFDNSEDFGKIGTCGYIGPHLNMALPLSAEETTNYNLGFTYALGFSFKIFNHQRGKILFNESKDLTGVFRTNFQNNYKFISRGVSFHFVSPISKINGISYFERRKMLKKEKNT